MYSKKSDDFNSIIADTLNLNIHNKKVYLHTLKLLWYNEHPYENISGLEKWFMIMIILAKMVMPSFWIRHYCEEHRSTRWIFEAYVMMKPIFFMLALFAWRYSSIIICAITIYLMLDLFTYILWILALSDIFVKHISIRRNLILLWANYREIISGFALLYLHFDALAYGGIHKERVVWPLQAIYYSLSTFSTVWFGDITASNDVGTLLSIIQLIVSIVFIGIILSSYVGKIKLRGE
jgi:hypothetical protein